MHPLTLSPVKSRFSVSTVVSDEFFDPRFSIPEIRVTADPSFKLCEKLVVKRGDTLIPVSFQGRDDDTNIWALDDPIVVDQEENFVLKIEIYRKPLFIPLQARPTDYVTSGELSDAYASGASEWRRTLGERLVMSIGLAGFERRVSLDFMPNLPSWTLFEHGERFSESYESLMKDEPPDRGPGDPNAELPSTTDKILSICPRFRILVIGKSGVGKSSLINGTFGVNQASVSEDTPGVSNINFEITSEENNRVVVHDSKGFEHGETKNLDTVKNFIEERSRMPHVKDRLHAIWLCAEIPTAGGRVFELGDEIFLSRKYDPVPVIVVFTKFDLLVRAKDFDLDDDDDALPPDKRQHIIMEQANASFQEDCVQPLLAISPNALYVKVSTRPKYSYLLQHLIEKTFDVVKENVDGIASLTSGVAQRVSADVKISTCIAIGKKRYWRALAASADFPGRTLKTCLDVLHRDIITVWNYQDPDSYLLSEKVKGDMIQLLLDVRDKEGTSPMKSLTTIGPAVTAVASATAAVPIATPIVVPIAVVAGIAVWVYQVYQRSHETIRCLMAYVVDLTLIMKLVFETQEHCLKIDPVIVDNAFATYGQSAQKRRNHTVIRSFVEDLNISDRFSSKKIIEKIEELIMRSGNDSEPRGSPGSP